METIRIFAMPEPKNLVEKITDRPVRYVCEICGHTVVKPSPESLPELSMLPGRFYACKSCGWVVCRSCAIKRKDIVLCKDCSARHP